MVNTLIVFSPFLYDRFKQEMGDDKVLFLMRDPIRDLPEMSGEGVLYLGDFSSVDRDFEPLITVLEELNIKLDLYGTGDKGIISKNAKNVSIYSRRPFSEIFDLISSYKMMVIILNRSGFQVPGKVYDFAEAPFKVLVLYEDYLDIKLLPQPVNYFYCKNVVSDIRVAVNELL